MTKLLHSNMKPVLPVSIFGISVSHVFWRPAGFVGRAPLSRSSSLHAIAAALGSAKAPSSRASRHEDRLGTDAQVPLALSHMPRLLHRVPGTIYSLGPIETRT